MSVYSTIPIKRPRRTAHNLTHSVDTCMNIGQLVPTARPIECVPGDTINVSSITSVDLMPLVRPFKGDLYLESWAFFVSNDMLKIDTDSGTFTEILTSASDPQNALPLPSVPNLGNNNTTVNQGSLWDYYGLPIGIGTSNSSLKLSVYPFRAYYKIWNEYFRDENLQTEVPLANTLFTPSGNPETMGLPIKKVNYKKDRFTSAFQSEQKGNPITISLGTQAPIVASVSYALNIGAVHQNTNLQAQYVNNLPQGQTGNVQGNIIPSYQMSMTGQSTPQTSNFNVDTNVSGYADLTNATALTINDLRLANKLQKWEERLQLAGSRPKEYLLANYGICPNDETLQRPVLIGHITTPVIVNSVVQNLPDSNSPAGSKFGNGVTVGSTHFGKWLCKEFGWLIVLSALRPKSNYTQGIHRSFIKNTIYDFFNPIFENLGQQEIYNAEVFAQNSSADSGVFGFTDRYNEYRNIESMTTGALRGNGAQGLQGWIMNRKFASLPTLSSSFITVNASEYDYLFNFTSSSSTPQAIIHSDNLIKAIRPISKYAHPSL